MYLLVRQKIVIHHSYDRIVEQVIRLVFALVLCL
jgi:hypothetical protein